MDGWGGREGGRVCECESVRVAHKEGADLVVQWLCPTSIYYKVVLLSGSLISPMG